MNKNLDIEIKKIVPWHPVFKIILSVIALVLMLYLTYQQFVIKVPVPILSILIVAVIVLIIVFLPRKLTTYVAEATRFSMLDNGNALFKLMDDNETSYEFSKGFKAEMNESNSNTIPSLVLTGSCTVNSAGEENTIQNQIIRFPLYPEIKSDMEKIFFDI